MSGEATFAVGDVVAGRYEVLESLGQRPLGWLYRAREREIGVEVTLWEIGPGMLPDEAMRAAFTAKMMRARALSHPNLVRVFGAYQTADEVVIAAQWAPGQTLYARLHERLFTLDEARPVLQQVARAMIHAHQHGVVLGDVHGATVTLLGATVKLTNVGVAPALPRKRFLEAVRETQGYQRLPPELRSGMTLDSRADVYSLAMLAVEMLTGGVDRAAVTGPDPLKTVLGRALADDPMVRHTSVDALAHELDAALSGQAPRPRRPTPPIGVPIAPPTHDDSQTGPVPKPEDVVHPQQELTRTIDPEELELLKGDQVTRQVPLHELLPLRAASSETQQVPLQDLLVDDESSYDELTLEQPTLPPGADKTSDDSLKTDQVYRLEPDAVKTTEHPRLPPPLNEDDIDTQRVSRADVKEMIAAEESASEREDPKDPNLTPLPPPMPQSAILTPPAMRTPLEALADAKQAPTAVHKRAAGDEPAEPKIEVSGELPIIDIVEPSANVPKPLPPKPLSAKHASPAKDEGLYDGDDAPTRVQLDAINNPPPPSVPVQLPPPAQSASAKAASPSTRAPTKPGLPQPNAPTPIGPSSSGKKRRNPFDPVQPEEDARTTEHRSPPPRRSPFDAPSGDVGAGTLDVRAKGKPRPTIMVPPLGKRSSAAPVLLVAIAAFIAAVGVALAISHYLTEQRLSDERRDKQRLADELNAQAEALRRQQAAHPDAGVVPKAPVVSHPEPMPSLLPRQGACPLGAHLVTQGGHSFCVDVYEYPGGNTMPRTEISFGDAGRICAARGERLCSEGEWERACRGRGNASFPYGQSFDATRCNTKGVGGEPAPSGTFAQCRSAAGAYDMSGNVAEWVASGANKGGSARDGAKESRCSVTTRGVPAAGGALVGFRCCADPTGKR